MEYSQVRKLDYVSSFSFTCPNRRAVLYIETYMQNKKTRELHKDYSMKAPEALQLNSQVPTNAILKKHFKCTFALLPRNILS